MHNNSKRKLCESVSPDGALNSPNAASTVGHVPSALLPQRKKASWFWGCGSWGTVINRSLPVLSSPMIMNPSPAQEFNAVIFPRAIQSHCSTAWKYKYTSCGQICIFWWKKFNVRKWILRIGFYELSVYRSYALEGRSSLLSANIVCPIWCFN